MLSEELKELNCIKTFSFGDSLVINPKCSLARNCNKYTLTFTISFKTFLHAEAIKLIQHAFIFLKRFFL